MRLKEVYLRIQKWGMEKEIVIEYVIIDLIFK